MLLSKLRQRHRTRSDVRSWIMGLPWDKAIAITLTFPPSVAQSRKVVEKHLRYFWNRVDKSVYGNRAIRDEPFRCPRAMFIEGGWSGRNYHAHGVGGVPANDYAAPEYTSLDGMGLLLQDVWRKEMIFNAKRADVPCQIEPVKTSLNYSPERWTNYITKTVNDWNWSALCLETLWVDDGPKP